MLKVKYIGFGENTGYGIAAAGLVAALKDLGVQVSFTSILPGKVNEGGIILNEEGNPSNKFDVVIVHTVPEYYPYWHAREKQHNPNVKVWGYTAWETDLLPTEWPSLLNIMDGVFVPSKWNKEIFKSCGITIPVKVLPHVSEFEGKADFNIGSNRELNRVLEKVKGKFIFYSIGVWNERKAPWRLVEAFKDEFEADENVALILKTESRDWTKFKRSWRTVFRKKFGSAAEAFAQLNVSGKNIYHLSEHLSSSEISWLHSAGNCFASFSRGEGWGMGAYEAAWFGKPVMITGQGGPLDFLPHSCSYLLDYDLVNVETTYGKESYTSKQQWAEVDILGARKIMRSIYQDQETSKQKGQALKTYVNEKYNPKTIAKNLLDSLNNG